MESGELVLLRCRITRGGFSGERVFRLMQADPVEEYVGAAPVDYCFHLDRRPIGIEEPGKGQPIEGLVTGRIIENGGSLVRVLFPDGETVLMTTSQIAYRRKTDYVPVGS